MVQKNIVGTSENFRKCPDDVILGTPPVERAQKLDLGSYLWYRLKIWHVKHLEDEKFNGYTYYHSFSKFGPRRDVTDSPRGQTGGVPKMTSSGHFRKFSEVPTMFFCTIIHYSFDLNHKIRLPTKCPRKLFCRHKRPHYIKLHIFKFSIC